MCTCSAGERTMEETKYHKCVLGHESPLSNVLHCIVAHILEDQMSMGHNEVVVFHWNVALITNSEQIIIPSTDGRMALHLIKELSKVSHGTVLRHHDWSGDGSSKHSTHSGHEVNDLNLSYASISLKTNTGLMATGCTCTCPTSCSPRAVMSAACCCMVATSCASTCTASCA